MIYVADLRTSRMEAVRDRIATGSGSASLEVGSDAFALTLIDVDLPAVPSSVSGDILTIAGTPLSVAADATGDAAIARIKDKNGVVVVSELSVGAPGSGANVIIDSVSIVIGQTVILSSATITHPS